MENRKVILRAIAGTVKFHTKEAYQIAAKYDNNLSKNPTIEELVNSIVINFFSENEAFAIEFSDLMLEKKQLQEIGNYNNAEGADPISAIAGAVGKIFSAAGSVVTQVLRNKNHDQLYSSQYDYGSEVQNTTQEILILMQTDNALEMQEGKSQTTLIISILGVATLITGIILYKSL